MTDGTQRAPEVTPDLRLRAERPSVTRLSRKALIGLGGAVGLAVAAALIYALQTRRGVDQAAKELYTTENRTTAEGVTALPRDYTGIPRLGRRCRAISAGRSSMHKIKASPFHRRGHCRSPELHPRSSGVCRRSRRRD